MLPFILAGAAIIAVGTVVVNKMIKGKCYVCDQQFFTLEVCLVCGKKICGTCGTDFKLGRCCNGHGNIQKAKENIASVETYSVNYKGKTPPSLKSTHIETLFYREKDEAEEALKFIAAIN